MTTSRGKRFVRRWLASVAAGLVAFASPASAQSVGSANGRENIPTHGPDEGVRDSTDDDWLAVHGQMTFVVQSNPRFRAAFEGLNSLRSRGETRETADVTLYIGLRPWAGGELWANPEIDQGFGLANTLGAAGFPSGEAYKVGKASPYFRLQRLFFRQTIELGGATERVAADLNQFGGQHRQDRLVVTVGKFSVGDVFDANAYAHDPRSDFLNWTLIDAGSLDYAADAWGYSYGAAIELYKGRWTVRAGMFNLSKIPNSETLERDFSQYEGVGELEERHTIHGRDGKVRVTAFFNHGNMGRFDDAVRLARATSATADTGLVRTFATRAGVSVNLEQAVSDNVGVFARAGFADGRYESFEFTDVDRTVSAGVSLKGDSWQRPDDRLGIGAVVNAASEARKRYLASGGLGILIGDGRLPNPGAEHIVEAWYDLVPVKPVHAAFDVQLIDHPAYNRDRGPVLVVGARLHVQL